MDCSRDNIYGVRVSDFEHSLIHRAADVRGVSASEFGRRVLIDAARSTIREYLQKINESRAVSADAGTGSGDPVEVEQ